MPADAMTDYAVRPAIAGHWPALQDIFGKSGASNGCWWMYSSLLRRLCTLYDYFLDLYVRNVHAKSVQSQQPADLPLLDGDLGN
jgi:hypothetical protein